MGNDNRWLVIGLVVLGIMWMNQQGGTTTPPTGGEKVDLCPVVQPSISATGQRMFVEGTSITSEYVRVIKEGSRLDLGQVILNSGTKNTEGNEKYDLYFGENSSTYYTDVQPYTAPCREGADDKVGVLCTIDTTPTLTAKNEDGLVQVDGTTNVQAMGASESVEGSIKIKVSADQCYGNPDAPIPNAICFKYNESKIETNKPKVDVPSIVSNNASAAGSKIECFEFNKLADLEYDVIEFTLTATSNEPYNNNMTIFTVDAAFDLDADTLEEIWGYEDEDDNNIGATTMGSVLWAYN